MSMHMSTHRRSTMLGGCARSLVSEPSLVKSVPLLDAYTHVYTHVYTYVCTHVRTHVHAHVHAHVYPHVYPHVYTPVYPHFYTQVVSRVCMACPYTGELAMLDIELVRDKTFIALTNVRRKCV